MTFEDRKQMAAELLVAFLDGYTPPRGMDDDQLAKRILDTADAFARRMPVGPGLEEVIKRVLTKVSDTHLSNTWPPQAVFVMAMPASEARNVKSPQAFIVEDRSAFNCKRMEAGQSLPETALWGLGASQLDPKLLSQYRALSVQSWRKVYGDRAETMMVARYGGEVEAYFSAATIAAE